MRKSIFLWIAVTSTFLLVWISISSGSEIKLLEDFKNSTFIKKYRQKGQMTSTQLKTEITPEARRFVDEELVREMGRGYSYSFSFYLGDPPTYDEYDWFSVWIVTKSKDNPIIYHIGIEFHDESIPPSSGPTKFNKHIREIFQDLISSLDSTLSLKNVVDYVQKQSVIKYHRISDAPKKTFGKYSFRVGTMTHDLFVSIDKASDTKKYETISDNASSINISSTEHLNQARKYLKQGYEPNKDPMKTRWGNIAEAEEHLKAIKHYDNEQQKADGDKLIKEIQRRKGEIEKVAKVVAKEIMVQQREDIGKKIDKVFLDQGMDVEVILEGNEKDILTLKYVLWSRPSVYKFTNGGDMSDGSFLSNLKKAGFKRVNFNNKYDYSVYYDLTK